MSNRDDSRIGAGPMSVKPTAAPNSFLGTVCWETDQGARMERQFLCLSPFCLFSQIDHYTPSNIPSSTNFRIIIDTVSIVIILPFDFCHTRIQFEHCAFATLITKKIKV